MFGLAFGRMGAVRGRAGAEPPLVVVPENDLFFDDFNGANASLTGRTGWTAYGDATKAGKIVADGGIARMLTTYNGQSPYGFQIAALSGTEYRSIEFEYDYSQQSGTLQDASRPYQKGDQQFIVAWQDVNNYLYFTVDPTLARLSLSKFVGGVTTEIHRYLGVPTAAAVKLEMRGDRCRLYINGAIWAPDQLYGNSLSAYPDRKFDGTTFPKTGGSGLRHSHYPLMLSKSMRVKNMDVTIGDLRGFYGRDASNKRDIAVSGTFTGTPISWCYRLRNKTSGSTASDWKSISVSASAGSWSATVSIPSGGQYLLDIGWTGVDGKTRYATSNPFSVGILVCYWGQSNSAGMGGIDSNVSWIDEKYNSFDGSAAHQSSTYRRWWNTTELPYPAAYQISGIGAAKSISDATGVPVGVAAIGVAAQQLALLKPGTTNWDTVLVPFIADIGGNVENWVWVQGESEGLSLSDYSNYTTDFANLVSGMRTLGGRSDASVFVRIIGKDTSESNTTDAITRAQDVRSILLGLENPSDSVWVCSATFGVALVDVIHPTASGHTLLSRRDGLTIARRRYEAITYDGRGPIVTGAALAGSTITLAIDMNGATSVTGAALTGYSVSNDDFATTLTISSADVAANQIVITLASAPTGTVKVRSYREPAYNDTSIALGNYADGTTIPVFPIINPITAI